MQGFITVYHKFKTECFFLKTLADATKQLETKDYNVKILSMKHAFIVIT